MRRKLHFPSTLTRSYPPIRNLNEMVEERTELSHRASDMVARTVGSWRFILLQSALLILWVILNATAWVKHWDPYPFILMNLVMSLQAAFTAPIIMMSQNRQSERDRLEARLDYAINIKTGDEVRVILDHLIAQDKALQEIYALLHEIDEIVELDEKAEE